jgi:hypothetical protein
MLQSPKPLMSRVALNCFHNVLIEKILNIDQYFIEKKFKSKLRIMKEFWACSWHCWKALPE